MSPNQRILDRQRNRSGVIYVTVLAISVLVMVMAMGALLASRSLARATTLTSDADDAAGYAFSAVELARYMITADIYWRSDYSPGAWFSNKTIGRGNMSVIVSTADSKFSNMNEDITFLGTGAKGSTTQKLKAVVHSSIAPLSCLSYVISAGGATTLNGATITSATAGLACNGSVTSNGASMALAVSAAGNVSGSYYQQQVLSGTSSVTLPSTSSMGTASTYVTNGTTINYSAISGGTIQKVLLSPTSDPYGSANSNGFYVINCGGNGLIIQNCRIVGTLVVFNCTTLQINGSVNWSSALIDYPCLLAQCNTLQMTMTNTSLQENNSDKVSYNAPGTPYPYPAGTSNSTYTDTFPSAISSLMYVTGNAQFSGSNSIGILIVGGNLQCSGTITPTYDSTYFINPPPAFYSNTLTTDSNTFSRSVN